MRIVDPVLPLLMLGGFLLAVPLVVPLSKSLFLLVCLLGIAWAATISYLRRETP